MSRVLAWVLRPGVIWLLMLTGAIFYSAVARWMATQRELQTEIAIRRVDRVLRIWAEHWGDPPETVKPLLLEALNPPLARQHVRNPHEARQQIQQHHGE